MSVEDVVHAVRELEAPAHRFISLTGGEPLLQPEAVLALAEALRGQGPALHLETHGVAVAALERVIAAIDVVAMDWKLASDVRPAPEVMGKGGVTAASEDAELEAMGTAIARIDPDTPVVVQPVTPFGPVRQAASAVRLLQVVARLSQQLASVRLIPQTHKAYGAP